MLKATNLKPPNIVVWPSPPPHMHDPILAPTLDAQQFHYRSTSFLMSSPKLEDLTKYKIIEKKIL